MKPLISPYVFPGLDIDDKIKVGDKVLVMGLLKTVITRIEGEAYYFKDESGREWREEFAVIEKLKDQT